MDRFVASHQRRSSWVARPTIAMAWVAVALGLAAPRVRQVRRAPAAAERVRRALWGPRQAQEAAPTQTPGETAAVAATPEPRRDSLRGRCFSGRRSLPSGAGVN